MMYHSMSIHDIDTFCTASSPMTTRAPDGNEDLARELSYACYRLLHKMCMFGIGKRHGVRQECEKVL